MNRNESAGGVCSPLICDLQASEIGHEAEQDKASHQRLDYHHKANGKKWLLIH